jgi:hypothetical protein
MMVTMAGLQVFIVRFFFQGARKGRFTLLRAGDGALVGYLLTLLQDMCKWLQGVGVMFKCRKVLRIWFEWRLYLAN